MKNQTCSRFEIAILSSPPTLSGVWDALSRPADGLSGGVRGGNIGPKTRPKLYGGAVRLIARAVLGLSWAVPKLVPFLLIFKNLFWAILAAEMDPKMAPELVKQIRKNRVHFWIPCF